MLGLIERRIGALEEYFNAVVPGRHKRVTTEADRHVTGGRSAVVDIFVHDATADLFSNGHGTVDVRVRQQHGKFFTAVTHRQIGLAMATFFTARATWARQ